jgi:hypothetical protein
VLGINVNIYTKWTIIVGLNSILGFFLGSKWNQTWFQVGIALGVISWLFAYIILDKYLINAKRLQESKRLTICACLRIPLQLTFFPDMYAGILASVTVEFIGIKVFNSAIIEAYFLTIFTGLYLSFICAAIYFFLYAISEIKQVRANA